MGRLEKTELTDFVFFFPEDRVCISEGTECYSRIGSSGLQSGLSEVVKNLEVSGNSCEGGYGVGVWCS